MCGCARAKQAANAKQQHDDYEEERRTKKKIDRAFIFGCGPLFALISC